MRRGLAYIHDSGHGDLAKAAAGRLIHELHSAGFEAGTVVDLGCGSGILAHDVSSAGYSVIGIDISESMIALARQRSPESSFRVGSFVSASFPRCIAAIGEVLNYLFAILPTSHANCEQLGLNWSNATATTTFRYPKD